MRHYLIGPGCALAALLTALPAVAGATPTLQPAMMSRPALARAAYRHRLHHHRQVIPQQQPGPQATERVPTGGGDYGGPDSAFPEGENSPVRPGGSYAVTAPIGSPAYAIQKEQQDRLCRDSPEVC